MITKTIYKKPSKKEMKWLYNVVLNKYKFTIGLYISLFQISQTTIGVNYTVDIRTETDEPVCTLSHIDTEDDVVDVLIEEQDIIFSSNTSTNNWCNLHHHERDTILKFARNTVQEKLLYFYANIGGV